MWSAPATVAVAALIAASIVVPRAQADTSTAPRVPQSAELVVVPALVPSTVLPSATGVASVLTGPMSNPAMGGTARVAVYNAATGTPIFESGGSAPATPASTNKMLTSAAVLTAFGADHRLTTQVVRGASAAEVVLVGAGDPLLRSAKPKAGAEPAASLADLAEQTAAAIKSSAAPAGQAVSVRFDDSLFTGPTSEPSWPPAFPMPPITALMVDGGYRASGQSDPSKSAAMQFAKLLAAAGVTVTGQVSRTTASAGAPVLASALSAPVSGLVQHTLEVSDNVAAEVLGHLAGAKTGNGGSFAGGAAASLGLLRTLNIPTDGVTLVDGSGLSRTDQIPPAVLARLLSAVATNGNLQLWGIAAGNPVAGFTGTLFDRFKTPTTKAGAGVVRAKTGTLTGVSALAGLVPTADGALLAFAFVAPSATNLTVAEAQWDNAAAGLAACGCRS